MIFFPLPTMTGGTTSACADFAESSISRKNRAYLVYGRFAMAGLLHHGNMPMHDTLSGRAEELAHLVDLIRTSLSLADSAIVPINERLAELGMNDIEPYLRRRHYHAVRPEDWATVTGKAAHIPSRAGAVRPS